MSTGRPAKGLTEKVVFMTTPEQKRAIEQAAEHMGDASKVIRKSISFFLASEVSKPNQPGQEREEVAA